MGLCSAFLAKEGFTGISSVINFSESALPGFGESYEIDNVYFKPYPCCRWTHPAMEGTINLPNRYEDLKPESIKKIRVKAFKAASHLKESHPHTIESAQYSIPFIIGMSIIDENVNPDQMTEHRLLDERILAIADRVDIVFSEELERFFPKQIPSEVEIETLNGIWFRDKVTTPKGDPNRPMSWKELTDKFMRLAAKCVDFSTAEKLIALIEALENVKNIAELADTPRKSLAPGQGHMT